MKRTAENLRVHELVGLRARVVKASDPTLVGRDGVVVYETMKTLHMLCGGRRIVVPKRETTFQFTVEGTPVLIEGNTIIKRPEDRVAAPR